MAVKDITKTIDIMEVSSHLKCDIGENKKCHVIDITPYKRYSKYLSQLTIDKITYFHVLNSNRIKAIKASIP